MTDAEIDEVFEPFKDAITHTGGRKYEFARAIESRVRATPADQEPVACPNCGGSLHTWKCDCDPIWPGYARATPADQNMYVQCTATLLAIGTLLRDAGYAPELQIIDAVRKVISDATPADQEPVAWRRPNGDLYDQNPHAFTDWTPLYEAAPQPPQNAADLCRALHYPEHWDTAAYPDVYSALSEVLATFQCECIPQNAADHIKAQSVRDAALDEAAAMFDRVHPGVADRIRGLKSAPPQKPVSDEVKP